MDKCVSVEPGEKIYLYSEGSHLLIETAQVPSPSKNIFPLLKKLKQGLCEQNTYSGVPICLIKAAAFLLAVGISL